MNNFKRNQLTASISRALVGSLAAAMVAVPATVLAQEEENANMLEEVIVTAQRRDESMQQVPISIEVLSEQTLSELNMQGFFDYAQMVPSILSTPSLDGGSSWAGITMRAINSGSRGHASTNTPTVGMYLDEMPITTQQGNLDIHLYDIARVEVLAGPQGTLFGASSQAGTIRVISNTPELERYSASVSLEGNIVDYDDTGYLLEGFVNLPINDKMAIRLVGWSSSSAGWIDNVLRSRTYPGVENPDICAANGVPCSADDLTISNEDRVADNYNTTDVVGGRAALRIDLNEDWTMSPTVMYQKSEHNGGRGEDISDFVHQKQAVSHIMAEFTNDEWYMLGLTIEGKIGNFDVVYSGGYLDRDVDASFDYADYAYWYDVYYTTGYYADLHFADTGSRAIENQFYPDEAGSRVIGYVQEVYDHYERQTHEIRVSSDRDKRLWGMLGLYYMDSFHDYSTPYKTPGLSDFLSYSGGSPYLIDDTFYLNSMDRDDTDKAIFGHLTFAIKENLELTVGARYFEPEQTLKGFSGYSYKVNPYWSSSGEKRCDAIGYGQDDFKGKNNVKPCVAVDKNISESGSIYRVNLNWQKSDDVMLYATWSEGYRPGGVNRNPNQGVFKSEFLTNYELGWKTELMDGRMRFNGAVFYDEWQDFQITFSGEHSITQIGNGPSAKILGLESQLDWLVTDRLKISAGAAYYDAQLTEDFVDYNADGSVDEVRAAKGTQLPLTPKFKGNVVARYSFPLGEYKAYLQGAVTYSAKRRSDLEPADYEIRGDFPSHSFVDLAAGIAKNSYRFDLFIKNALDNNTPWYDTAQCSFSMCGEQRYVVRERPITIALKFTKDFE